MKIGFCGAGSTGKTTTAKLLEQQFGIPEKYQPSIVRGVMERWGVNEKTSLNLRPEQRLGLQIDIFGAKEEQDRTTPNGIFDRTLIDQLTYCLIRCHETMPDSIFEELRDRAFKSLAQYDILFYFPVFSSMPYEDDGFRVTGRGYQTMQDILMHGFLCQSRASYRVARFAPKEERARNVYQFITSARGSK